MKKPPVGVMVLGGFLIISSIDQMRHIPLFGEYVFINHGLSMDLIKFRFFVSWMLRTVGLMSGIGILFLQERFRKLLIVLSMFSILTVYLRHTYSSFILYTTPIYYQYVIKDFSLQTFTWIAVFLRCSIEVIFSGVTIYYLTRSKVKEKFLNNW